MQLLPTAFSDGCTIKLWRYVFDRISRIRPTLWSYLTLLCALFAHNSAGSRCDTNAVCTSVYRAPVPVRKPRS